MDDAWSLFCPALVEGVQVTRRGVPVCLFLFGAIVIPHHVEVIVHAETLSLSLSHVMVVLY
jgi:hypothetical protein